MNQNGVLLLAALVFVIVALLFLGRRLARARIKVPGIEASLERDAASPESSPTTEHLHQGVGSSSVVVHDSSVKGDIAGHDIVKGKTIE